MDISMVIADVVKVFMFGVATYWGCSHRRLLGAVGFGLLAVTHVVTALAHAGVVANDSTITHTAVNLMMPAIAMSVCAYIIASASCEEKDRWSVL